MLVLQELPPWGWTGAHGWPPPWPPWVVLPWPPALVAATVHWRPRIGSMDSLVDPSSGVAHVHLEGANRPLMCLSSRCLQVRASESSSSTTMPEFQSSWTRAMAPCRWACKSFGNRTKMHSECAGVGTFVYVGKCVLCILTEKKACRWIGLFAFWPPECHACGN